MQSFTSTPHTLIENPANHASYFEGQHIIADCGDKVRIGTVAGVELVAETNKGRRNKYAGEYVIRLKYDEGRYGMFGVSSIVKCKADKLAQ